MVTLTASLWLGGRAGSGRVALLAGSGLSSDGSPEGLGAELWGCLQWKLGLGY